MNPFLSNELADAHIRDLHEEVARGRRPDDAQQPFEGDRSAWLVIRRFGEDDIDAVRRLAALDEKPVPAGGVLVAEVGGELVAALPLEGGEAIADPFRRTADVVALLRLRANQLASASATPAARAPLASRLLAPLRRFA